MAENLKALLLSSDDSEILLGLEKISPHNFFAHLPCLMEVIKRNKGDAGKSALKVVSDRIREILKKPDAKVEGRIKDALLKLWLQITPDIQIRLLREFSLGDPAKKMEACYLLRAFEDGKAASRVLSDALTDNNRLVRACAIKALGTLANQQAPGIIIRFLSDRDSRVRANAVEAMEETGNENMIGVLLRVKNDTNNRVRANVLKNLFEYGYKEIDRDLTTMLKNPDELMRASGVWVIGEIGLKDARFEPLLAGLKRDKSELVRTNVLIALDKIARSRSAAKEAVDGGKSASLRKEIIRQSAVTLKREKTRYFEVVKVTGMLNVYSMIPLKLEAQDLLETGQKKVALDFAKVDDVDSNVIQFLKNLNKRFKTLNGKFMIFNVRKDIMDIFHIANLDSSVLIFGIEEKVEHLLA